MICVQQTRQRIEPQSKVRKLSSRSTMGKAWCWFSWSFSGNKTRQPLHYFCMDYFSKYSWSISSAWPNSSHYSQSFTWIYFLFWMPLDFTLRLYLKCALTFLHIKKTRTTQRNPKGNGLMERFNLTPDDPCLYFLQWMGSSPWLLYCCLQFPRK